MRSFLKFVAVLGLVLLAIGLLAFAAFHTGGGFDDFSVTVDGERIAGSALGFGGLIVAVAVAALLVALGVALVTVIGVLASLAILVALAIVGLLVFIAGAMLVGLAPLVLPVLLGIGAYVLLVRLFRRTARPTAAAVVPATPPHA